MIVLWILCILILLVTALCLTRIRVLICANTEISVKLSIYGIKIPLYPQNKKKANPKKFKKGYPKAKPNKKAKESAKDTQKKDEPKEKIPIGEMIDTILFLLKKFFSKFFKYLRLDVSRIIVTVGAEDAAKCAVLYGGVSQSVAYLLEFLDRNLHICKKRSGEINVRCDFTAESISYDIFLSASLTVWQILDIGISLAYNYLKGKDIFHLIKS